MLTVHLGQGTVEHVREREHAGGHRHELLAPGSRARPRGRAARSRASLCIPWKKPSIPISVISATAAARSGRELLERGGEAGVRVPVAADQVLERRQRRDQPHALGNGVDGAQLEALAHRLVAREEVPAAVWAPTMASSSGTRSSGVALSGAGRSAAPTDVPRRPARGRRWPHPPRAAQRSPPCRRAGPSAPRDALARSPELPAPRARPHCARGRSAPTSGCGLVDGAAHERMAEAEAARHLGWTNEVAAQQLVERVDRLVLRRHPQRPPPARARTGHHPRQRPPARGNIPRSGAPAHLLSAAATAPGTSTPASETPTPSCAAAARLCGARAAAAGRTGCPQLSS